jgi:hypothetical protein
MAVPNLSDIVATTIEWRSKDLADNVTRNNALLAWLKKTGNVKTVSGGTQIFQEFTFAENGNFAWYSGFDLLQVAAQDVISGATFPWKQAACPVVISGLEQMENNGRQAMIDLLDGRISAAEATMANNISAGLYSDGTGAGGKQLTGLAAAVPTTPTTGTYGGIDRSQWQFWRSQILNKAGVHPTNATIQTDFNSMYASLVRGTDRPKLILADSNVWQVYMNSLQLIQRFVDTDSANLGFPSVKFMDADVVLDGGIGGFAPAWSAYFINPKYLFYRPHEKRNMVPLSPNKRIPLNQDAEVQIIAWMGNMTCNGAQFQGYYYAGP